jgi:outer membrane lipoprotein-sorting protein
MRKTLSLAAALLFAMSVFAADLTVDEILAKNIEAKGGADKLRALQSVKLTGKLKMGPMEAPFVMLRSRPEKMKMEFTIQGMTGIQAYDGTSGWSVMPFMGKKEPEAMTADVMKEFKEMADFDGSTFDYAKKGHKVELLGKGDVEGTPAYKLKLTTKDGNESTIYIDAETFLEVKVEGKRKMQGQEIEAETIIGNYQEFDGLLFPMSLDMKAKGAPAGQSFIFEKVEINPKIEDSAFKMPVAAKTETKQ